MSDATGGTDFVAETRAEIEHRIEKLQPRVVEFGILRIVLIAIDSGMPGAVAPRTRAEQVLWTIAQGCGPTPGEIASRIGISAPKVYPVLRNLEDQGLAHRDGRRWHLGPSGRAVRALVEDAGVDEPPPVP